MRSKALHIYDSAIGRAASAAVSTAGTPAAEHKLCIITTSFKGKSGARELAATRAEETTSKTRTHVKTTYLRYTPADH